MKKTDRIATKQEGEVQQLEKVIQRHWKDGMDMEAPKTEFIAVKGDIAGNHDADAIVNTANTSLLGAWARQFTALRVRSYWMSTVS